VGCREGTLGWRKWGERKEGEKGSDGVGLVLDDVKAERPESCKSYELGGSRSSRMSGTTESGKC
jgi:hypothetical protein